jgi:dynein light chain 4
MAAVPDLNDAEYRKLTSKALTRSVDMSGEMATECLEIVTMGVDKHMATKNYEAACQLIKQNMDKKFGASWHCAIGEGFGFDITYQSKNMVYVYYGPICIVCFKC